MCEFHDSNGNGYGDIWWTDKLLCFSSIDGQNGVYSMDKKGLFIFIIKCTFTSHVMFSTYVFLVPFH